MSARMAANTTNTLIAAIWAIFVVLAAANDVTDSPKHDVVSCMELCDNTYPSHTYEKGNHNDCCRRGCRFYTIMEFMDGDENVNSTQKQCTECCLEAYKTDEENTACSLGCKSQPPFFLKKQMMESENQQVHMLYPLMYVHSMYSNMIEKASHSMSVSWSLYMESGNGKLVVVKSEPHFYTEFNDAQDLDDYKGMMSNDDKTANYLEMNIEPIDNAATPNLKHSQLRSARGMDGDLDLMSDDYSVNTDWLTCIARKTGIPRLLLCLMILFCAIVMIWLCLTAAVTAPEHRIHSQKLSINGDLEYLREMVKQGKGIQVLRPQEQRCDASPLPIKIRVERI